MRSEDKESPRRPAGVARVGMAFALVAVALIAYELGSRQGSGAQISSETSNVSNDHRADEAMASAPAKPEVWTCSMHPQIRLPGPGACPICGMDLIPVVEDAAGGSAGDPTRQMTLSPEAVALARLATAPVERRWVDQEVRLVGRIDFDATRLQHIAATTAGRIDRLFANVEGTPIRVGDHLASIYSPGLLAAQEELLQARAAVDRLGESTSLELRRASQAALEAVRDRLRLWGLEPDQIAAIEERGAREDHVTLRATRGGIVTEIHVREGEYVKEGDRIYTLPDLSHLWVMFEAYESDLPWLRYGQRVGFTTEARPGEEFEGRVALIDPVLDSMTRTATVRVDVDNTDARLKPGMFVRGVVRSRVLDDGGVAVPELAGKWISPMHPEIVKDGPGVCDVCGMDLVPVESLGIEPAGDTRPPLVVPASAPLITGRRAVVYVEVPGAKRPTYEGREVELGPRAGAFYVVRSGLAVGERVVVEGAFKIDAAMQIVAKPSMMSPEGGTPPPMHDHGGMKMPAATPAKSREPLSLGGEREIVPMPEIDDAFRKRLAPIYDAYLEIQEALASDDAEAARGGFGKLASNVEELEVAENPAMERAKAIMAQSLLDAGKVDAKTGIDPMRTAFEQIVKGIGMLDHDFGHAQQQSFVTIHCPMAFGGRGADWLQVGSDIRNPYFGAKMLKCGEIVRESQPGGPGQ